MIRDLMEAEMYQNIGNPNGTSRYGCFFYEPKEELTKRERKFNVQAESAGKINTLTLGCLDDVNFLRAYQLYQRRYNTWM